MLLYVTVMSEGENVGTKSLFLSCSSHVYKHRAESQNYFQSWYVAPVLFRSLHSITLHRIKTPSTWRWDYTNATMQRRWRERQMNSWSHVETREKLIGWETLEGKQASPQMETLTVKIKRKAQTESDTLFKYTLLKEVVMWIPHSPDPVLNSECIISHHHLTGFLTE